MSYLPVDLVEEILSRIPAISMTRLRPTCKLWNALFQSRGFREKHFCTAPKESLVLLGTDDNVCSLRVNLNVAAPSIEFKSALTLKDYLDYNSEKVYIKTVFHCDGLLLCTLDDARIVVWNPCLGETRWIQLKTHDRPSGPGRPCRPCSTYALGYQNNHSYKILKCWDSDGPRSGDVVFEIYEFSSDSWNVFDEVSMNGFTPAHTGVSLKGNSYWVSFYESDYLVSFDFTTERFKHLCLPLVQELDWEDVIRLSIVREEQLLVLHLDNDTSIIDIWIANNIGDTLSFLIDEEKKVVVCCNISKFDKYMVETVGEDDAYHTKYLVESSKILRWTPCIFSYVPSLVQI
ncbi:hypothetical protein CARUB_v10016379mg [Capsella rubella]|uniref:F-box domain-containing protein n=1 Tax=Capsella rubella TaxID=81985 RepID=R0GBG3_9BRAS|nr:hypothetical protein CARUB_v10016379mg [Capsella rubella]